MSPCQVKGWVPEEHQLCSQLFDLAFLEVSECPLEIGIKRDCWK